jgi:hypothetical protein
MRDLATHDVANDRIPCPDRGIAPECHGLREQAGGCHPVAPGVELVDSSERLPVRGLTAGDVDVASQDEGRGTVEWPGEGPDDTD